MVLGQLLDTTRGQPLWLCVCASDLQKGQKVTCVRSQLRKADRAIFWTYSGRNRLYLLLPAVKIHIHAAIRVVVT